MKNFKMPRWVGSSLFWLALLGMISLTVPLTAIITKYQGSVEMEFDKDKGGRMKINGGQEKLPAVLPPVADK